MGDDRIEPKAVLQIRRRMAICSRFLNACADPEANREFVLANGVPNKWAGFHGKLAKYACIAVHAA